MKACQSVNTGVSSFEKFVVVKSCYSHLENPDTLPKKRVKKKGLLLRGFHFFSEARLFSSRGLLSSKPWLTQRKANDTESVVFFFSILVCAVIMADDYNTVNTTAITRSVFAQENTTSASLDDNGGKSQVPKFVQVSFYQVLTQILLRSD